MYASMQFGTQPRVWLSHGVPVAGTRGGCVILTDVPQRLMLLGPSVFSVQHRERGEAQTQLSDESHA